MVEQRLTASAACESCPSGRYSSAEGVALASGCISCPPGKASNQRGNANDEDCASCTAGKFSSTAGALQCQSCDSTETSMNGSTFCTPSGSKICVDSSGCSDVKATFEACTAGTYGEVPPTKQCLECPVGYSSSKAATECQPW